MNIDLANQLKKIISNLQFKHPDDIIAQPKWGELNFESCREHLEIFFDVVNNLNSLPLERIPSENLNQLRGQLDGVISSINSTLQFEISSPDAINRRNQFSQNLLNALRNFNNNAITWIPFLGFTGTMMDSLKQNFNKKNDEINTVLDQVKLDIAKKQMEIDSILNASREASATTGVSQFAQEYEAMSTNKSNESVIWFNRTKWLAITTALLATLPILGIIFFKVSDVYQLIQLTTVKIFILTLSFSATVWCGRMYKTSRNLEEINRHRATALKTFQTFVQATKNDVIRDAVLIETTRSIFAHTPTGYVDGDNHSSDMGTKYFELIKATIPSNQT